MLLRSSSTPLLGSLLSSFPESPATTTTNGDTAAAKHPPTTSHNYHNLSFHQYGSLNLNSLSHNSSPISPSVSEFSDVDRFSRKGGFRRAQSEGNLEGLAINFDEFSHHKFSRNRPSCSILDTIPSFSFNNSKGVFEDDVEEEEQESDEEEEEEEVEMESCGERIVSELGVEEKRSGSWDVGFGEKELVCPGMYLAKGLGVGVDAGGSDGFGGGRGGFSPGNSGRHEGDGGLEEYYRRMVEENPSNTLFLRNCAQFLYQSKGDLNGAEEYYSRAILTDPNDGEILSQYAKLVWELHGDQDRASRYFERAVQTAPQDSHVLASYAGFLWETEEDEDEVSATKDNAEAPPQFHKAAMASASA